MSPMNGYETTSWLTDNYPEIPVLAFSDIEESESIIKISMCGAKGCTEKNISSMEQFNEIMKCIMNGGKHYDTIGIHKLVNKYLQMDKNDIREGFLALTNQENEVMKLADEEMTAEEKAKILNIKKPTFYKHVSNIYEKLNINKASSLRNLARKYGLID
jgi:DNA-binding NarL/FixJ family response regulator